MDANTSEGLLPGTVSVWSTCVHCRYLGTCVYEKEDQWRQPSRMALAESLADEGEEEAEAIYEFPTSCPTCGAELAFHRLGLDDAQLVLLCTADKARIPN